MVSKLKKIIYSSLTLPIACLTFSAFKWQWRRMDEKIIEIKQRTELLSKLPEDFTKLEDIKEPIEFTPVKIKCQIEDTKNYYKIINTNDSSPGYRLIYCVKLINSNKRILVDFGWIPEDYDVSKEIKENFNKSDFILTGIVYKGDKNPIKNKYDSSTDISGKNDKNNKSNNTIKNLIYFDLQTFIDLYEKEHNLNDILKNFCIKRINFEENIGNSLNKDNSNNNCFKSNIYPKLKSKNDLLYWYITPEVHRSYYIFWSIATFLNLASNMYVWMYL